MSSLFNQIFSKTPQISTILPHKWAEANIIIPGKGKCDYNFNPYCKRPLDMLSPDHPAKRIAFMKGSQITISSGLIMPGLCYIIAENPCNTFLMVGTPSLVVAAGMKLDQAIEGANLNDYLSYATKRSRNNKSGDTDEMKYFSGNYIKLTHSGNKKSVAQVDLQRIFLDDFDAMDARDKETGAFLELIEMRAAASANDYKLVMISTPLAKESSNIEPAYMDGNRERYFLECPCCHEPIIIEWVVEEGAVINPLVEGEVAKCRGGIIYDQNNHDQLIKSSVHYVCYKCGGAFNDRNKQNMLRGGIWTPTAIPVANDYFSFHLSSLYAPVGMFSWAHYAQKWIEAHPGGMVDEYKMRVLVNTCFGQTYETQKETPKASDIMGNMRPYKIGVIPDALSMADGNGRIILVTCAADLNGTKDDARLDYLIVAWSESGASYCIKHGSIGTFVPRENTIKNKENRQPWSCRTGAVDFSVWTEFDNVTRQPYYNENGEIYYIDKPCIDMGHEGKFVEDYLDWTIGRFPDNPAIGVRGQGEGKYAKIRNSRMFSVGLARNDIYYLTVGLFKDRLAINMRLKSTEGEVSQPSGFMNFPHASDGLFEYPTFFEHFEQEECKLIESKTGQEMFRWVKKKSNSQNHMFDCFVYNMARKEIIVWDLGKELIRLGRIPEKEFTWVDYANYMTGKYKLSA